MSWTWDWSLSLLGYAGSFTLRVLGLRVGM